jgi:uncharacterized protein
VIIAPRRYGKSSLIRQAFIDAEIPGKRIDLLPATNVLFINKAIKLCFSELINQIAPKTKMAKEKLIEWIKNLHPKLTLSFLGQQLEVSTAQIPEESIEDLLVGLDAAAKKVNKRVVVCLDEFQQVGLLKDHHAMEAAIRHAVEQSSHITYIFSGSSRHLLHQMFHTKSRPLYHLCELMELDRIKAESYHPILLERAKKQWKEKIKDQAISEILNITRCHPYYVNALCRQLWKMPHSPEIHIVQKTWLEYIETQSNWITDDLSKLTPNQRNILAALAYQPIEEPYSHSFSERVKMGASSIKKSLDILTEKDFIYREKDRKYKVLDPATETWLHKIKYFDFIED